MVFCYYAPSTSKSLSKFDRLFCQKLYNKSYFEAARRLEKRSLLGVNEHFTDKADAKRALLDGFRFNG